MQARLRSSAGTAYRGGNIYNAGTAILTSTTISAAQAGGGIHNTGTIDLTGGVIRDNLGSYAGGLSNTGTARLARAAILDNTGGSVGGLFNSVGTLTLTQSTLIRNSGTDAGGLLNNSGTATLAEVDVFDNTSSLRGGGLHNSGTAILTAVTFTRNHADAGGALYNAAAYQSVPSQLTVENATFWGNDATGAGDGGAIMNLGAATFTNTTVTGNSGSSGGTGGGVHNSGTLTLQNSIVAGNAVDGQTSNIAQQGTFIRLGGNILGGTVTNDSNLVRSGVPLSDIFDGITPIDPDGQPNSGDEFEAGALWLNGGPAPTVALRAALDNPAIDAGADNLAPAGNTDARGLARFDQARVANNGANITDLGAYELQAPFEAPSLTVSTALDVVDAGDDETSLREALILANGGDALGDGLPDAITFAAHLAGASLMLTQGALLIESDVTIDGDIDHDGKADIAISSNHASRLFTALSGTSTLNALKLRDGGQAGSGHIGGAIAIDGAADLTILNATIADNNTGFGGAIWNEGHTRVINTTLSGNSATVDGGAIFHLQGTLSLINTTLSGNRAGDNGGAIFGYAGMALESSTIAGNRADLAGGGIYAFGSGALTVTNSIVAANATSLGGPDIQGTPAFHGLNVVGFGDDLDVGDHVINAPDIAALFGRYGLDPHTQVLSGVLADNRGPVQTIAIHHAGPASNAGDPSLRSADSHDLNHNGDTTELLPVDARGLPRVSRGLIDIGAFEVQDNAAPVNTVPGPLTFEANTSNPILGLSVLDADSSFISTTLSARNGSLTVSAAGGAIVQDSGTAHVTINGTLAAVNATLGNVIYRARQDHFGDDVLTIITMDSGDSSSGNRRLDIDLVPIRLDTWLTGTPQDDSYTPLPGNARIDGGLGTDTITFSFRLTDATVSWSGNRVVIDGPGSRTVLTGFETYVFTDGTVHNDDGNPLVDDVFYYARNHDVWAAQVEADAHYHAFGWYEKRDPNAFFSISTYLSANPDVRAADVDPLLHWSSNGWMEGRIPSIAFDPWRYLEANPDVKAAHVDPLAHFLQTGAQEGRTALAAFELLAANGFDYVYYLQRNPDVAAAQVDPLWHFQTTGWREGRNPNVLFNVNGYLAAYGDVAAAGINPLDHYHQWGWQEGRDPSLSFDTKLYLAANPDVAAAHIDPLKHFLEFGLDEGRAFFPDPVWG
jgi:hypothetical protein